MAASDPAPSPSLLWFRRDLRLEDNVALSAALGRPGAMIPVFILDEHEHGRPLGGASRWWLGRSLTALKAELERRGSRLVLRSGPAASVLSDLVAETGAGAVFWNRVAEPAAAGVDLAVRAALAGRCAELASFAANLMSEPGQVLNGAGETYRVFTAYWRAAQAASREPPARPAPSDLRPPGTWPRSDALEAFGPVWAEGFNVWTPGEAGAEARLDAFLEGGLNGYASRRDELWEGAQSRLSPHLHWGEISVWAVARAVRTAAEAGAAAEADAEAFIRELGWRDFAHDLLAANPDMALRNLRPAFDAFPWSGSDEAFRAWTRGMTGYPIVDAAMRELWATGYMPGRARMIAGSFLVKDLLVDWRRGEAWFWDTLADAGPAANAMNWQWTAGSGVDAQPFFRIFNPVGQGAKFDPEGDYVRRWLPELARLPARLIHAPWTASPLELEAAGVRLGKSYPEPIVDHAEARRRALDALAATGRRDG